jgi:hypothetical protein
MLADKIDTTRRGIDITYGTFKLHLETVSNIFDRKLYLFHIFFVLSFYKEGTAIQDLRAFLPEK